MLLGIVLIIGYASQFLGDAVVREARAAISRCAFQATAPHDYHLHELLLLAAADLEGEILPHVGARVSRDATDSVVVADFINGIGLLIDSPD